MGAMRDGCRASARVLVVGGVLSLLSAAPFAQAPPVLTLDAAFARALEANPTIAASRLRRPVDLAGIDVARERPNPEAHVEFERETKVCRLSRWVSFQLVAMPPPPWQAASSRA